MAPSRVRSGGLARLGLRLGIPLHPHRLRHTYACEVLAAGINLHDLAHLLGHASIATTEVCLHLQPDELARRVRAAVERPSPALPLSWAA